MMRDLLVEAQSREPAPRQMHAQLLPQLACAGYPIQITNQQNPQQQFGINRRSSIFTVAVLEAFPHKPQVDVLIDESQQVSLGNLIFQTEVVEQRLHAGVV